MVAFALDNRRVRFNISLSATRVGKLTLSSRLLAVARSVVNDGTR
jgi:YfiR/HmsC-like